MIGNKSINDALVFYDVDKPWRLFDAIGNNVSKFIVDGPVPADDTTNVPTGVIVTQAGTSPLTVGQAAGYPLLITTGATEWNGANVQARGESLKLVANKVAYAGIGIKLSEATELDCLFGLCELKTDLLLGSVSHGVTATLVEGAFFLKTDGATTIAAKLYKDGAQTFTASVGVAQTVLDHVFELYWDGTTLSFYLDGVFVTSAKEGLPDGDLTLSLNVKAGSAAARTASIAWARSIFIG